jgi:outer membrane protein
MPHIRYPAALFPAALLLAAVTAGPARAEDDFATQPGTMEARLRAVLVDPTISGSTTSVIGGGTSATDSVIPEADFTYFFTPNIAVEAIAGVTRHEVAATNTALGRADLGSVWLLPPTVTAQYHFGPESAIDPYLGAGLNYTFFFNSKVPSSGPVTSIDYGNNFGAAIQAGADFALGGGWLVNIDIKHIFLNTKVKIDGGAIDASVDLDPTLVGIGLGYRF